jgi:hypothetical protein
METHAEARRQYQPELFTLNQHNIVNFIKSYLGHGSMTAEEEKLVHELCGAWDTNAFEIRHEGLGKIRALFKVS